MLQHSLSFSVKCNGWFISWCNYKYCQFIFFPYSAQFNKIGGEKGKELNQGAQKEKKRTCGGCSSQYLANAVICTGIPLVLENEGVAKYTEKKIKSSAICICFLYSDYNPHQKKRNQDEKRRNQDEFNTNLFVLKLLNEQHLHARSVYTHMHVLCVAEQVSVWPCQHCKEKEIQPLHYYSLHAVCSMNCPRQLSRSPKEKIGSHFP